MLLNLILSLALTSGVFAECIDLNIDKPELNNKYGDFTKKNTDRSFSKLYKIIGNELYVNVDGKFRFIPGGKECVQLIRNGYKIQSRECGNALDFIVSDFNKAFLEKLYCLGSNVACSISDFNPAMYSGLKGYNISCYIDRSSNLVCNYVDGTTAALRDMVRLALVKDEIKSKDDKGDEIVVSTKYKLRFIIENKDIDLPAFVKLRYEGNSDANPHFWEVQEETNKNNKFQIYPGRYVKNPSSKYSVCGQYHSGSCEGYLEVKNCDGKGNLNPKGIYECLTIRGVKFADYSELANITTSDADKLEVNKVGKGTQATGTSANSNVCTKS